MMSIAISVIIPIYNVEPYIEACLQSVVNQTMVEGIECILVDDCGSDRSLEKAENFVARNNSNISFQILHHEHNRGLSAARNTGICYAKGEYLLFLDSDDELLPNAIECFVKELRKHPGVDLIQGLYKSEMTKRYDGIALPEFTNDRKEIKTLMLDYDKLPVMAQNRLVRRKLLEDHYLFFKEGVIHEDCYWTFFLAKYVSSLACLKDKTYYYKVNPSSITGKPNKEKETYSFRVIIEDFTANIDPFLRGEQKTLIWYLLLQAIDRGYYNDEEEKEHLFHCLLSVCLLYEKPFMKLWYSLTDDSFLKGRLFNFIVRLYRL